jgi:Family of unknown function (DUF6338)
MPEISKEVISLLIFLMPGFLTAWVIYGLTSHTKPIQFERVIQALIFTVSIKALVFLEQKFAEWLGTLFIWGTWTDDSNMIAALISAILLGLLISKLINSDYLHNLFRRWGFTSRSSHPNEWSDVLSKFPSYVVLHLTGERRIYGWPEVWPSDPKNGHFFIISPAWLNDSGAQDITGVEGLLIDAKNVEWIEVMENQEGNNP